MPMERVTLLQCLYFCVILANLTHGPLGAEYMAFGEVELG